jgi:hypothetical protein
MQKCLAYLLVSFSLWLNIKAQPTFSTEPFISFEGGVLSISESGRSAPLLISSKDWPGVIRAFRDLQADIGKVTSSLPEIQTDQVPKSKEIIIAGTIGKSHLIDEMIKRKKIDLSDIDGKWEAFSIQVINKPLKGVKKALVICGSDKRGTIYGIYEVSRQIGISPWYWWSDVTPEHKSSLYALPGKFIQGSPSVKYRGIFLNDEAPDLTNWIRFKYGTVTPGENPPMPNGVANYGREFYSKLFELMLRLKANYLWPAMWNNAFNEDDPENPRLADEYGIVMGNSHQEPMLRAQKEWDRRYQRKIGSWNYAKNPDIVEAFWREGIKRNRNYESIVTIGLRGANDTPMAPGGPEENMALLEKIVEVQRKIIGEEINPDVTKVPQLWCLYKEVQDYYNAGMRVPDDVTLLWAEDNWGNVRRLPTPEERTRSGGAGIYYHFDYHGGPRSYQWINTNTLSKIWDQMSLAKQYGADRIWIVNVGHFKGYELPMEYFLDLGWNTNSFNGENIKEYTRQWTAREFGSEYAEETAEILSLYTKYNSRRKPELLSPSTYNLVNYGEAETVVADYKKIADKAEELFNRLPVEKRNAFYHLVLFPVKAGAIVNELYVAAGKNDLYYRQDRSSANLMAEQVNLLFLADTSLMGYYNREFADGKWNHFMDQSHLGYTSWADPPVNSLRAIKLNQTVIKEGAYMGVAIEGSEEVWPGSDVTPLLPEFDNLNNQKHYIEIFNKGKIPYNYKVSTENNWVKTDNPDGIIDGDKRIWVSIDWEAIPEGKNTGIIKVSGPRSEVFIRLEAFKRPFSIPEGFKGYIEGEGFVAIEAEHFSINIPVENCRWSRIEDYGHTLSAMRAEAPANSRPLVPGENSPSLIYNIFLFNTGDFELTSIFSPTLNFIPDRPLRYAVAFDNAPPQIITLVQAGYNAQNRNADWEKSVSDNAKFSISKHSLTEPGYHTLKIWMVDPGPVLQKIILNTGGLKASYLGPPESFHK